MPTSTYRLQVHADFDLDACARVCAYLDSLGVGAVYVSPILPSAQGSQHGYDVTGFDRVDPNRGGEEGWQRLLVEARSRGLGVVVDIVPNHTGVADASENEAWWSLLREGRASPFAHWFDIDWGTGRLLLPVLGDDFSPEQLAVEGDELRYFEHRFPVAPATGEGSPADVHERQHYRLVNFREADNTQNYRRFFAVTSLAGLRVEDERVFDATHEQIRRWANDDHVDGLRVDHPDGLADPAQYLERLRELAGPQSWLTVEKILEPGERLPQDWPVDGTTGYDALTEVSRVFVDPAGVAPLDDAYRQLTGDSLSFPEHVEAGKRFVAQTILRAEVLRLARLVTDVPRASEALTELLVAFPVYRSYAPHGLEHMSGVIRSIREARPDLSDTLAALEPRLTDPNDELCSRFQQTTGAVMAKGVEDTAYYRYTRFIAANEVGGDPERPASLLDEFHAAQQWRQAHAPRSMTTLSTHDTKRGEDVRARLAVLAELPDEWMSLVATLMDLAPLTDKPFAYLLWQTIVGAGFIERERMHAYAEKAMREAAVSTGWIDPDAGFEASVHEVIDRAYDEPGMRSDIEAFIARIAPFGRVNSLAQKLVQLTMPGVPDVYQGTEVWEDSLVDPDNRRPVDFGRLERLLTSLDEVDAAPRFAGSGVGGAPVPDESGAGNGFGGAPVPDESGAAKLWVVSRALRLRRERPDLFHRYNALAASGSAAEHVVAFDRGGAITAVTRLPVSLERRGSWGDTSLALPPDRSFTDVLTGARFEGDVRVAELFAILPVALLVSGE